MEKALLVPVGPPCNAMPGRGSGILRGLQRQSEGQPLDAYRHLYVRICNSPPTPTPTSPLGWRNANVIPLADHEQGRVQRFPMYPVIWGNHHTHTHTVIGRFHTVSAGFALLRLDIVTMDAVDHRDMLNCHNMQNKPPKHAANWQAQSVSNTSPPGVSSRAKKKSLRTANRNERSRGRSLLHGQDMGKTQDHRNRIEQWLAVGGWQWEKKIIGCLKDTPAPQPNSP